MGFVNMYRKAAQAKTAAWINICSPHTWSIYVVCYWNLNLQKTGLNDANNSKAVIALILVRCKHQFGPERWMFYSGRCKTQIIVQRLTPPWVESIKQKSVHNEKSSVSTQENVTNFVRMCTNSIQRTKSTCADPLTQLQVKWSCKTYLKGKCRKFSDWLKVKLVAGSQEVYFI